MSKFPRTRSKASEVVESFRRLGLGGGCHGSIGTLRSGTERIGHQGTQFGPTSAAVASGRHLVEIVDVAARSARGAQPLGGRGARARDTRELSEPPRHGPRHGGRALSNSRVRTLAHRSGRAQEIGLDATWTPASGTRRGASSVRPERRGSDLSDRQAADATETCRGGSNPFFSTLLRL